MKSEKIVILKNLYILMAYRNEENNYLYVANSKFTIILHN